MWKNVPRKEWLKGDRVRKKCKENWSYFRLVMIRCNKNETKGIKIIKKRNTDHTVYSVYYTQSQPVLFFYTTNYWMGCYVLGLNTLNRNKIVWRYDSSRSKSRFCDFNDWLLVIFIILKEKGMNFVRLNFKIGFF